MSINPFKKLSAQTPMDIVSNDIQKRIAGGVKYTNPITAAAGLVNSGLSSGGVENILSRRLGAIAQGAQDLFSSAKSDPARSTQSGISNARHKGVSVENSPEVKIGSRVKSDIDIVPESKTYYMTFRFSKYHRQAPFTSPEQDEFETELIVKLPLPQNLRDDTSVNYNNTDLKTVGDILNGDASATAFLLRKSAQLTSALTSGVAAGLLARGSSVAGNLVGQLSGAAGTVVDAAQIEAGVAPNPNPAVMFQGPALRDHNFDFTFYPETPDESRQVMNLIREFKKRQLPRNANENNAAVLRYPQIVRMNFYPWDSGDIINPIYGWTENSLIRIKTSVIKSVSVNYAGGHQPSFFDGTRLPVSIQMNITTQEIEYMLASDWGYEYDKADAFGSVALTEAVLDFGKEALDQFSDLSATALEGTFGYLGVDTDNPATGDG